MICKSVADGANVGKDVERAGRANDAEPLDVLKAVAESLDFAAKPVHVIVASLGVALEGGLGGPLGQRWGARGTTC